MAMQRRHPTRRIFLAGAVAASLAGAASFPQTKKARREAGDRSRKKEPALLARALKHRRVNVMAVCRGDNATAGCCVCRGDVSSLRRQ